MEDALRQKRRIVRTESACKHADGTAVNADGRCVRQRAADDDFGVFGVDDINVALGSGCARAVCKGVVVDDDVALQFDGACGRRRARDVNAARAHCNIVCRISRSARIQGNGAARHFKLRTERAEHVNARGRTALSRVADDISARHFDDALGIDTACAAFDRTGVARNFGAFADRERTPVDKDTACRAFIARSERTGCRIIGHAGMIERCGRYGIDSADSDALVARDGRIFDLEGCRGIHLDTRVISAAIIFDFAVIQHKRRIGINSGG